MPVVNKIKQNKYCHYGEATGTLHGDPPLGSCQGMQKDATKDMATHNAPEHQPAGQWSLRRTACAACHAMPCTAAMDLTTNEQQQ
jgi:hypothetical protein